MNMDLVQARQEPENVIPHIPVLHTKLPFTSVIGSFVAESGEFEAAADITSGAAHEAVLQTRKKLSVVHSQAVAAVRHRVQQDKINTLDEIFQAVILLAAFYSASCGQGCSRHSGRNRHGAGAHRRTGCPADHR